MAVAVQTHALRKVFRARDKAPGLQASVRGLFAPRYREVEAVRGIDLRIEQGEVLAFIGPNGAGKSTTIKMLTGILHPTSGEARVLGLVPWREREKLAFRIASVFGQRSQLWYHLPPGDSFELLARIYEVDQREYRARVRQLVAQFDVEHLLRTPVRKLSLGERMRCEIVGSLLHRPAILFLDEPTIGLDVVAKQLIREHIQRLNDEEGTTVFLTSHDAGDVETICRRVVMVNHGQLVFDDSVSALKQRFLRRKRIELKVLEPLGELGLRGMRVVRNDPYDVVVEVDTTVLPIETAVARLVGEGGVADLTIEDPPLEQIIAAMYRAEAAG